MEVHWDTRGLYVSTPLCGAFCEVGTRSAFVVDLNEIRTSALCRFLFVCRCRELFLRMHCWLLWATVGCIRLRTAALIDRSIDPVCSFALQGPKAAQVLAKLIDQSKRSVDLAKVSFGESFGAHIGGAECFVSRQSQTELTPSGLSHCWRTAAPAELQTVTTPLRSPHAGTAGPVLRC